MSCTGRKWGESVNKRCHQSKWFKLHPVQAEGWLACTGRDFWELLINLQDDQFVHLALLVLLLLPQDTLQDALQVRKAVLVLQIGCGADDGVHQRQILHSQLPSGRGDKTQSTRQGLK